MMVNSQWGLQQTSSAQLITYLPSTRRQPQAFGDENEEHPRGSRLSVPPVLRRVYSQPISSNEVGAVCSGLASKLLSAGRALTATAQRASTLRAEPFGDCTPVAPPTTPSASGKKLESSSSGHPFSAFWDFSVGEWAPHHPEQHSRPPSPFAMVGSVARDTDNALTDQQEAATWTVLHTIAALFPEAPTTRQQKDVRNLIESLARVFPCTACAEHLQEILRKDPPSFGSGPDLQRWVHCVQSLVKHS